MMRFNQCGEDETSLRQHIAEHQGLLDRLPDGDRFAKDNKSCEFWRKQYVRDVLEMRKIKLAKLSEIQ